MANRRAPGAAHTRWWQTFEIVAGIPFLAALALQQAAPLALPVTPLTPGIVPGGLALTIAGLAIIIRARRELARHGQPTDPGRPTSALVTSGVFARSRNPLYLGGLCVLAGVALALNLPWALILLLPTLAACNIVLIGPEERYLAAAFGDDYRRYAATVHRWVGRK